MPGTTVARTLHDAGLAAWFGGTLMGAVGLNGASGAIADPLDRVHVTTVGWARWAPLQVVAIAAHLTGGALLRRRADGAAPARGLVGTRRVVTGVALAAMGWQAALGAKVAASPRTPAETGVKPLPETAEDLAPVLVQLRVTQWLLPAATGALLALDAHRQERATS